MSLSEPRRRLTYLLSTVALLVLVACSPGGGDEAPTPTTAPPTQAATPTLMPGQLRVGDLLARVEASWGGVTSLQSVFTTTETGQETPARSFTVEEVKPDRRRVVISEDNVITDEQIAVAGVVYLRGSFVANLVAPNVGAGAWVTVDPDVVPPDTPVGQQVGALLAPIAPPYQSVSEQMRALPATLASETEFGGRPCAKAYTFSAREPTSGGQIDYTLALDESDRLCALQQIAGPVTNLTIFTYDAGISIEAPLAATPVSGTPEG